MMNIYEVWSIRNVYAHRGIIYIREPLKTKHTINARTHKEAEYKLKQRFKNGEFRDLFVRQAKEK